jgi:hypothetical protein
MATQSFQVLYTSLFEMNYNLCKKQVNETVWKKLINLILIKTRKFKITHGLFFGKKLSLCSKIKFFT